MKSSMYLKKHDKIITWSFIGNNINNTEFDINLKHLKRHADFDYLYIDIGRLEDISNAIINKFYKIHAVLHDKKVFIINVNAVQNTILNLLKTDKMFQIYLNEQDAIIGKTPIVNRCFKLVS